MQEQENTSRHSVPERIAALNQQIAILVLALRAQYVSRLVGRWKIQHDSMTYSKYFLTFASEISLVVTLVSRLAKFGRHFFLDFIFL